MADLPPFDPQWLAAEQMGGGRIVLPAEPVGQSRERFAGIFASVMLFIPPPTDAVKAVDVQITEQQRVRIYTPTAPATSPLPIGLYIHSGGWYGGSIESEDFLCRTIAEKAEMVLFSPTYRLAPEHPYPAGLDDCCAAYEYMHAHAAEHGADPTRKFIMGGSAGGNLSACVGLKYTTHPNLKPSGIIAACMMSCDPSKLPAEYRARYTPEKYADAPMIGNDIVRQARKWYNPARLDDPLYSPLLHPDIKHLPPIYLPAPTKDPTHQETVFFHDECVKQGVDADLVEWVGWPHFFWILPMLPKSAEFMEVWCAKLRGMVARSDQLTFACHA